MPASSLAIAHAILAVALLILGALALTARKSHLSRHPRVGNLYFLFLALALSTGMVVGWQSHPDRLSIFQVVTPPTFALGTLGWVMAQRRPRRWLGQPWLFWHIVGQSGSYIGVLTATAFQIVHRFVPPSLLLTIALFAIPTALGSVLIGRTLRRWGFSSGHQRDQSGDQEREHQGRSHVGLDEGAHANSYVGTPHIS